MCFWNAKIEIHVWSFSWFKNILTSSSHLQKTFPLWGTITLRLQSLFVFTHQHFSIWDERSITDFVTSVALFLTKCKMNNRLQVIELGCMLKKCHQSQENWILYDKTKNIVELILLQILWSLVCLGLQIHDYKILHEQGRQILLISKK